MPHDCDTFYRKHDDRATWFLGSDEPEIRYLQDFIREQKIQSLLDIGCGYGKLFPLVGKRLRYTGIDISKQAIRRCREYYPDGNFLAGNVLKLSGAEMYELIVDIGCLHMLTPKEQRIALDSYARMLQSSGWIFIRYFETTNPEAPIFHMDALPIWGSSTHLIQKALGTHFEIQEKIVDTKSFDLCRRITSIIRKR